MRERLAFSLSSGLIFLGIMSAAFGIFAVQFGPVWEVPPVLAMTWLFAGVVAILLCLGASICYLRGNRFRSLGPRYRKIFWMLFSFGFLVAILSYVLLPCLWVRSHPLLSVVVRVGFVPFTATCGILWFLLNSRIPRPTSGK